MYTSIQESDDDVDTTLRLAVPEHHHHHHHGVVMLINFAKFLCSGKTINANPKPAEPAINLAHIRKDTPSDFLGLGIDASSNYTINHDRRKKSMMREQKDNHVKKERAKRSKAVVDEHPEPANPSPELLQRMGTTARPVFLYRKQLEESDILKNQNRLYFNDTEKLMGFLRDEERNQVVNIPHGKLGFVGIDRMGREYELSLTKWKVVTVINKDWSKMIAANRASEDHWVDIWGYRCGDDKFRLAFDFHEQL
ncbi:hypothetical protein CASFOL_040215 [Castilleja foliolosa]|uniref:B3 domain-containing protein n=1 Tax=Castilleja foliolosa TaxID=1961234 RepID=A0ABD3BEU6_9LAMI